MMVDTPISTANLVHNRVKTLLQEIHTHLVSSLKGSLLQTGIRTVLLGAPNAGKSSFLNILAQRPASIVSPEPGTTRDVVEVMLDIAGFPCIVGDTAGLREGADVGAVEQEGVLRAKKRAESSNLRILIVDATLGVEKSLEEVRSYFTRGEENVITVLALNKIDLMNWNDKMKEEYSKTTGLEKDSIFPVSCLTKDGIDKFGDGIAQLLQRMTGSVENVLVTNERQRQLLSECIQYLQTFVGRLSCKIPTDFLDDSSHDVVMGAEELKYAANALGKISGKIDAEEVLGSPSPIREVLTNRRCNIRRILHREIGPPDVT